MNIIGMPLWAWIVFYALVLIMLVADLKMFGRDPFIVFTSNIFAILGLRALYFALAAVAKYFTYLKYGLGIILIFVGVKMLLAMNEYINSLAAVMGFRLNVPHIEVPTPVSLAVIFGVLLLSMLSSVVVTRNKGTTPNIK